VTEPNAPTTVASRVRLWIDARSQRSSELDSWVAQLQAIAEQLASRWRVEIALRAASRSAGSEFSAPLRAALVRASEELTGRPAPELVCYAGHDAGVLAERVPAAMVLVRNEHGVSHSPQEIIELEDAALAARVVDRALAGDA
jgi:beta-ureidopropionase / N-carbamoyl-L-amino-acid hydrolase